MKQTAVEWLQGGLELIMSHEEQMQAIGLFEQAKEMEKQQIINAYLDGNYDKGFGRCSEVKYYNTKFKNK